jgi:hypothetical protein
MAHNLRELTPPPPKEIMLQWWHEVRMREKGKIVLLFRWLLFWYTPKEWTQKVIEINGLLKVQSTLSRTSTNPSTNAHVVINCGVANLNYITTSWQR